MHLLHGSIANGIDAASQQWTPWHTDPICLCGRINPTMEDRIMAQNTAQPLSISARKLQAQADAVLDQMFAYFTREEAPRVIETRRAA